jgi:hypothetical protein
MYEIEGNMKECKCTNKLEVHLKPQESISHGFPETVVHNVTQTINDESVWTMKKYVTFVNRNQELYDEMMEEEIITLEYKCGNNGKGNTPFMKKVLRENRNHVIEFNACNKADGFKDKKWKEDLVKYVHQERSGGESRL